MAERKQMIFQVDSPEVLNGFDTDNYSIEYSENKEAQKDFCVIYFSSNEIYYPNTSQAFEYSILKRDKYEWQRNRLPQAHKHIFIRDIRKQWYIGGINSRMDNPLKLTEFLKKETDGFRVFCVGSSAGGFAAILFGSLLKVDRVYAFNAQLNLNVTLERSDSNTDPILHEKATDNEYNIFYDVSKELNQHTDYYYFQSCHSEIDTEQYNNISPKAQEQLSIIRFKTSNHGFPFLRVNLPYVLAFDKIKLNSFVDKTYHPLRFSINLIGVKSTLQFVFKAVWDRYNKKRLESKMKRN
jgi:hypothetical protein